jgi:hypothetical protein
VKRTLSIFTVLTIVTGLARAEDLKKLTLDDASVIGTTIQTDTQVKAEGKGSIKITTQWPTTICLGEVARLDIALCSLLSARLSIDTVSWFVLLP